MTVRKDVAKSKERAERAELIREKFEKFLLKALDSDNESERKAAAKLYSDDVTKQLETALAEIEALKKSAGDKTELIDLQDRQHEGKPKKATVELPPYL